MSHTAPKSLSDYRKDIDSALEDSFLRRTLDTFAVAYRANREAVFKEVDERGLIKQIADAKDDACKHMEELYEQFRRVAEERGVHVHRRGCQPHHRQHRPREQRQAHHQVQVHDR